MAQRQTKSPKAESYRWGVEIECFLPSRKIEELRISIGGYHNGRALPSPFPQGWKAEGDGSLRSDRSGYVGIEIVSPILSGRTGIEQVKQVAKLLREHGAVVNPTCGFHCHVGPESVVGFNFNEVADWVAKLMYQTSMHETALYASTGTHRRENGSFSRSIKAQKEAADKVRKASPARKREILQDEIWRLGRYKTLNLTNLFTGKHTVEFRFAAGTTDWVKMVGHILTCLALAERATETAKMDWDAAARGLAEGQTEEEAQPGRTFPEKNLCGMGENPLTQCRPLAILGSDQARRWQMQITIQASSSIRPSKKVAISAVIPEPLTNAAGAVAATDGQVSVSLIPDAKMIEARITKVDAVDVNSEKVQGREAIGVRCNKGRGYITIDNRPDLAALLANRRAILWAIDLARNAYWDTERRESEGPLLAKMEAEVQRLIALIPADDVQVDVRQTGSADGDPILDYSADGVKLSWRDVTIHGVASAIRPGAQGAFAERYVGSISRSKLEALRQQQSERALRNDTERKARQRELMETAVPASAVAAYREYGGDEDKAWEAGDETSWAEIRRWTPYIEAQGLANAAATHKAVREFRRDAAEQPVDY